MSDLALSFSTAGADSAAAKWALQRFTVDVLQHQVVRPDIVNLANVGMVQGRNHVRFLLKPLSLRSF